MSNVDTIKELRELTGLSFKEINSALAAAGGDKAKAIARLKQLGATVAEKKSTRRTGQGVVETYVHSNGRIGVLLVLLCETDFVAKNPEFKTLAHALAMHIAAMDPKDDSALLAQPYIKDPSITVRELVQQAIAKLGENIKLRTFLRSSI